MAVTELRVELERAGYIDGGEYHVLKRITTGNKREHFATFELSGPLDRVEAAWATIREQSQGTLDYIRNSDIDGARYIGLECVWCEVKGGAA